MNEKVTCLIVDDEKDAIEGLYLLLQDYSDIKVLGFAQSGVEAIEIIDKLKPQMLFLDIQMPEVSGFDVLRSVHHIPEVIIFVSAHDQYALKAFEVHALDYLLKPVSKSRFSESIQRALSILASGKNTSENLQEVLESELKSTTDNKNGLFKEENRIVVKSDGKIHFLDFDELLWIEGYDYYVRLHTTEGTLTVRETLKNMEKLLPEQYIRIHRSSIIHVNAIKAIQKLPNKEFRVTISNGHQLKVSRSYGKEFDQRIQGIIE